MVPKVVNMEPQGFDRIMYQIDKYLESWQEAGKSMNLFLFIVKEDNSI